jgi:hypothetical protein
MGEQNKLILKKPWEKTWKELAIGLEPISPSGSNNKVLSGAEEIQIFCQQRQKERSSRLSDIPRPPGALV